MIVRGRRAVAAVHSAWRLMRWFVSVRKAWRSPRTSDVLIFDAQGNGVELLLNYLAPWTPEILHIRGELINLPVVLRSLLSFGPANRNRYFDHFVRSVRPRLIVTYIDNNPAFYSLSVRNPGVKTLFVQNGVKSYHLDVFETMDGNGTPRDSRKVDYMMTFGRRPGAQYERYLQGTAVPMGSLKNNLYRRRRTRTAGRLAFISQYRRTEGFVIAGAFRSHWNFFERADRLVLSHLAAYVARHGKTLCIVTCSGRLGEDALQSEHEYYERLLGQPCSFLDGSEDRSAYDATDSADVVVTIDSALGYESAARGNRTAFFSIRSDVLGIPGLTYGWPGTGDVGPFWTNRYDPDVFERILDRLFAIGDDQWHLELAADGFADIMAYDPGNTILSSVLTRELGPPPAPAVVDEYHRSPSRGLMGKLS